MSDAHQLIEFSRKEALPVFTAGDTVNVTFKITEGDRERQQAFQGTVIKKKAGGTASSFTVRKTSYGIGVEKTFPVYSPLLVGVEVLKKGKVSQGKLYYLRKRSGKAARIKEK